MSTARPYDVALVGYGPVGALLAALLGRYGLAVLVLEKETTPYALPRAAHLDDEALRVLAAAGAVAPVLAAARPLGGMDLVTAEGDLLLRLRKVGAGAEPYGFPAASLVHQPTVETALRDCVAASPSVTVHLGHTVERLVQTDDVVTLEGVGPEGPYRAHARYVVGCDGASSLVRDAIGSTFEGGPSEPWLVVDVALQRDLDLPTRLLQICDPRRPTTYVPFPGAHRRWEFKLKTDEEDEDPAALARHLLPDHVPLDAVAIERAAVYRFRGAQARPWRHSRVLLAGDAAHTMPPFLGQGLGAGIRDAHNLAWKLALVARGRARAALLDTYEAERSPHVAAVTRLAVRAGRFIGLGRVGATVRDAAVPALHRFASLRRVLAERETDIPRVPLAFAGSVLPRRPLLPQPMAEVPSGRVPLDRLLGDGFALVGLGTSPRDWAAGETVWQTLVARAIYLVPKGADWPETAGGEIAVRDDLLAAWLHGEGFESAGVVLVVRPDRHLFGIYHAGEGARAAAAVREALGLR